MACNKKVWDGLEAHERGAILAAIEVAGRSITSIIERKNAEAVKELTAKGVGLYDFSKADRLTFRTAAMKAWEGWKKKSPEAKALIEMHVAFMKSIGLL